MTMHSLSRPAFDRDEGVHSASGLDLYNEMLNGVAFNSIFQDFTGNLFCRDLRGCRNLRIKFAFTLLQFKHPASGSSSVQSM